MFYASKWAAKALCWARYSPCDVFILATLTGLLTGLALGPALAQVALVDLGTLTCTLVEPQAKVGQVNREDNSGTVGAPLSRSKGQRRSTRLRSRGSP